MENQARIRSGIVLLVMAGIWGSVASMGAFVGCRERGAFAGDSANIVIPGDSGDIDPTANGHDAGCGDDDERAVEITFSDAPGAVKDRFEAAADGAGVSLIERTIDDGVARYEIEYDHPGGVASIAMTGWGEILEIETPTMIHQLPGAIRDEILKDYPGATIDGAGMVQLFYFKVRVSVEGGVAELSAFASGDINDGLVALLDDRCNAEDDGCTEDDVE